MSNSECVGKNWLAKHLESIGLREKVYRTAGDELLSYEFERLKNPKERRIERIERVPLRVSISTEGNTNPVSVLINFSEATVKSWRDPYSQDDVFVIRGITLQVEKESVPEVLQVPPITSEI